MKYFENKLEEYTKDSPDPRAAVSEFKNALDFFQRAKDTIPNDIDLIALDWAGIGDANCHSRLILENLASKRLKIAWCVTPKVAPLYKDDKKMLVIPSFYSPFRGGLTEWLDKKHNTLIDEMFDLFLPKQKHFHISAKVTSFFRQGKTASNFSDIFFKACEVERDFSIVHTLNHTGDYNINGRYILLEHCGKSCGSIDTETCSSIVNNLKSINIQTVLVGAKEDAPILNCIDLRGLNLYDCFSVAKKSLGIIGKSSGNQSLFCFLRDKLIFEMEVPQGASYRTCSLHPNVITLDRKNAIEKIREFLK